MELIRKNIHMEHCLDLASTQISLEEDQNISDQKPDAVQIVCKKANTKIAEVKIQEDTVYIKGVLLYEVLYLTDEKEKRLCNMEGEVPFEEKVYINPMSDKEGIRVAASIEDLIIRLINSRKLNIRCVITLLVTQDKLYDEEVIVDVDEPGACEILKKPLEITTITLDTKDIYRIKEEITLPDGLPNIYNLLWKNIRVDGLHFVPMDGKVGIQGEWTAFFLYEGEEEETVARYFEVVRPFSGLLEVADCRENMILIADCDMDMPQVEVRSDYDGEDRLIGMEMELKLFLKLYQNTVVSTVIDAYGLREPLEPIMKESTCEKIVKKENGKIKLSDAIENRDMEEDNIQILHVDGHIIDEKNMVKEEEAVLSGVVHVEILCSTDNESVPYRNVSIDLPYNHIISALGADGDSSCLGNVNIEQMNAAVIGTRIEVRVMLNYQININKRVSEPLLVGLGKRTEAEMEEVLPAMAVYFARDNESIWDIGKKYRVSLNDIRTINQLNSDELNEGQKIVVMKEMGE